MWSFQNPSLSTTAASTTTTIPCNHSAASKDMDRLWCQVCVLNLFPSGEGRMFTGEAWEKTCLCMSERPDPPLCLAVVVSCSLQLGVLLFVCLILQATTTAHCTASLIHTLNLTLSFCTPLSIDNPNWSTFISNFQKEKIRSCRLLFKLNFQRWPSPVPHVERRWKPSSSVVDVKRLDTVVKSVSVITGRPTRRNVALL